MPLSSEQWEDVERRCTQFHSKVVLRVDGYELSLQLERKDAYRNVIAVYIDGKILGEWMLNDCEQRRRFFNPQKVRLGKLGVALRNLYWKIDRKKYWDMVESPPLSHTPYWNSFAALKRHLIKHNTRIELVNEAA